MEISKSKYILHKKLTSEILLVELKRKNKLTSKEKQKELYVEILKTIDEVNKIVSVLIGEGKHVKDTVDNSDVLNESVNNV